MINYLDRLKKIDGDNFNIIPHTQPTKPTEPPFDGFDGSDKGHIEKNNSKEVISNWWLIHFIDREPLQVAIWPPCNHAKVIESYPNAVAAEPISSPIDESMEATAYY